MSEINILHISDLHIAQMPELKSLLDVSEISSATFRDKYRTAKGQYYLASYSPGKLTALAELIYKLKSEKDLKAIIITGDIATSGRRLDLETALEFIEGRPAWKINRFIPAGIDYTTIKDSGISVYLLPGNHDRYEPVFFTLPLTGHQICTGYRPGDRTFHSVFSNFWNDDVKKYDVIPGNNFSVAVLGADFSLRSSDDCEHPQRINSYAQGLVYRDILEKLVSETEALLSEYRGKRLYIIWAIHFMPDNPSQNFIKKHLLRTAKLLESKSLISAAENCKVSLILCGHVHKTFDTYFDNSDVRLFVAGSATQFSEPNGNFCQLITIKDSYYQINATRNCYQFDEQLRLFK